MTLTGAGESITSSKSPLATWLTIFVVLLVDEDEELCDSRGGPIKLVTDLSDGWFITPSLKIAAFLFCSGLAVCFTVDFGIMVGFLTVVAGFEVSLAEDFL